MNARRGLTAICLGFLMITLDSTIVTVALGPIVNDLGGSLSAVQWVVNGYTLAFAALLLAAGALSDRIGARAGYLIGLAVSAVGSAACGAAPSMDVLLVARVVQGVGAAWLMPCSLALIAHAFPSGHERRRALAIWAGCSGLGLASGPVLGGVLTAVLNWRAIFVVNIPIALVAAWLLWRHVEETPRHPHRLDAVGQVLATVGLALLTVGFIDAGQRGWISTAALTLLGGGLAARVLFTIRQQVLALDLREVHHLSPFVIGVSLLPMTVATGGTAFFASRLVARVGEWRAITAGLSCAAVGAVLVAVLPTRAPVWVLVLATLPIGLNSLAMPAMTAAALAHAPLDRVGLASGVLNTARQTGGALGVAILGALLDVNGSFALHSAFSAIVAMYLAGLVLSILGARQQAAGAARELLSATGGGG